MEKFSATPPTPPGVARTTLIIKQSYSLLTELQLSSTNAGNTDAHDSGGGRLTNL